jgi:hypothetical protein
LFGIFSFPLIYQPFHVVVHHGHSHCAHCTIICSESHSDFGFAVFADTDEKEEPCPICNYHFPINEIPAEFLSLQNIVIKTGQVFSVTLKGYSNNHFSNLKPRAPPTC